MSRFNYSKSYGGDAVLFMVSQNACIRYVREMALNFSRDPRLVEHIAQDTIMFPDFTKVNYTCFNIIIVNNNDKNKFVKLSFAIVPTGLNKTLLLEEKAPIIMEYMLKQDNSGLSHPERHTPKDKNSDEENDDVDDVFCYNGNVKSFIVDFHTMHDPMQK